MLLLTGCTGNQADDQERLSQNLPPCSAEGSPFEDMKFDDWKDFYHARVSGVVEAHLRDINRITTLPLQCTADNYAELMPASEELQQLASVLPAWKDPARMATLTEADASSVLLEFLRVYECSMNEREQFLSVRVSREHDGPMDLGDFIEQKNDQKKIMAEERAVARTTLERTLGLVGGYDRLRPLSLDIECIKRASLDLRNVLGLASDASACLPRIWDTHQSLRDLKDE